MHEDNSCTVFTQAEQATCPDCQKQTIQMNISSAQADTMRQMTLKNPAVLNNPAGIAEWVQETI